MLYRGNSETFVTRFSRIGLNAIHEGWRVPDASRARYRSVREMCFAAEPPERARGVYIEVIVIISFDFSQR